MAWPHPAKTPAAYEPVTKEAPFPGFGTAALLAGGASERMRGTDKQFLDDRGKPLAYRILERLGTEFPELLVVTRKPDLYRSFRGELKVLDDRVPGFGPLSGLHAALTEAAGDWVYLVACDMPEFDPRWVRFLSGAIREAELAGNPPLAAAAGYGNHLEPFHAFYSRLLLPHVERAFEERTFDARAFSIGAVLGELPRLMVPEERVRAISPDWGLFRNINTPLDWEAYRAGTTEISGVRPGDADGILDLSRLGV